MADEADPEVTYDPYGGTLYITIKKEIATHARELAYGVVIRYNIKGEVIGVTFPWYEEGKPNEETTGI